MKDLTVVERGILGKLYELNLITVMILKCIMATGGPIHELCGDSGEVSSAEGAYGTIKYTPTCNSTVTSSITINRPTGSAHKYAIIEGVAIKSLPCQVNSDTLYISSMPFCIDPGEFHVFTFHQSSEPLTITATGIQQSFTIKYYTTGKFLNSVMYRDILTTRVVCE